MTVIPFIGLQIFKVKLFFEDSLQSNTLNHLKTKVTPQHTLLLYFLQYDHKKVRVLTNLIFFSFGLVDDQKSFNAACKNVFLQFLSSHYEFLNYFEMFSFLSAYNPGRVPPVKYHLCWIYASNKNIALKAIKFNFSTVFWNLLQSKF